MKRYIVTRTEVGIMGELGRKAIDTFVFDSQYKAEQKIHEFIAELSANETPEYIQYNTAERVAVFACDLILWVFGYTEVDINDILLSDGGLK